MKRNFWRGKPRLFSFVLHRVASFGAVFQRKNFKSNLKAGTPPRSKLPVFGKICKKSVLHNVLHRVVFNRFFIPIIGILSILF